MNELLSSASAPFIVGIALALVALAIVLSPVFSDELPAEVRPEHRTAPKLEIDDEPVPGSAIEALREIEFDRATGKLSEDDYDGMKARYTVQALAELRERDGTAKPAASGSTPGASDIAERMVLKYRPGSTMCVTHGLRPEPDALFCSECGAYLPGKCEQCGTKVTAAGAHFCTGCGHVLAA
ncbi:MAG TPA: zinc ribbon domain-containing protein [Gemmatimonadaceae bacterium]|nr:zinc ribbon domain-containing protein [Gemmatimonadaceae bacterium]